MAVVFGGEYIFKAHTRAVKSFFTFPWCQAVGIPYIEKSRKVKSDFTALVFPGPGDGGAAGVLVGQGEQAAGGP
jgi:hypothetical protein